MNRLTVNSKRILAGVLSFALLVAGAGSPLCASAAAKPKLNKKKATIKVGKTVKLKLKHAKKVKWSSNKKKVASVSSKGLVKGKKKGTAKITAKSGGKKYTCKVTVKAAASSSNNSADTETTSTPVPTTPTVSTAPPTGSPSTNPSETPAASATVPSSTDSGQLGDSSTTGPSQSDSSSGQPGGSSTAGPGQIGSGTDQPGGSSTTGPGQPDSSSGQPGDSSTAEPGQPGDSNTAEPSQTDSNQPWIGVATLPPAQGSTTQPGSVSTPAPTKTPGSSSGQITSSEQVPSASGDDTLTVGTMSVKLGMSKEKVEISIGGEPTRQEVSPLGFDVYIYNPSGNYTNYLMLQFDNDEVVGMSTISNYFTYEDILTSGQEGTTDLAGKGFTSMRSKYDYEAGYMYTGDNEYVLAFVDHQGTGKVYAVEVLAKQTSISSGDTNLDDLFKAEKGTYNETINAYMAQELFDWANAFRAVKRLCLFTVSPFDGAQKHSEDMASKNVLTETSSDGTSLSDRFDEEYGYWIYSAECNASRSIDAFGFVTWMLDNEECGAYSKITKDKDQDGNTFNPFYLATGFANTSASQKTFATLDLYSL